MYNPNKRKTTYNDGNVYKHMKPPGTSNGRLTSYLGILDENNGLP